MRHAKIGLVALLELLAQDDVALLDPFVIIAPREISGRIVTTEIGITGPVVEIVITRRIDRHIGHQHITDHAQTRIPQVKLIRTVGLAHTQMARNGIHQSIHT